MKIKKNTLKMISYYSMANEDGVIPLTVSIGVTGMHSGDARADDALIRADRALYRAKESGRNKVAVEV